MIKRLIICIFSIFRGKAPLNSPAATIPTPHKPRFMPEYPAFYDALIIFKNPPLIGKVFHHGRLLFRVIGKEIYRGRWKCELELI